MWLVNKQEDLGDFSDEHTEKGKLFELEDTRLEMTPPASPFILGPEHTMAP